MNTTPPLPPLAIKALALAAQRVQTWALLDIRSRLPPAYWHWILFGRADDGTIWTCSSHSDGLGWKTCNLFTARRLWAEAVARGMERVETHP